MQKKKKKNKKKTKKNTIAEQVPFRDVGKNYFYKLGRIIFRE